jgi:hypothetical protein
LDSPLKFEFYGKMAFYSKTPAEWIPNPYLAAREFE